MCEGDSVKHADLPLWETVIEENRLPWIREVYISSEVRYGGNFPFKIMEF